MGNHILRFITAEQYKKILKKFDIGPTNKKNHNYHRHPPPNYGNDNNNNRDPYYRDINPSMPPPQYPQPRHSNINNEYYPSFVYFCVLPSLCVRLYLLQKGEILRICAMRYNCKKIFAKNKQTH